MRSLKPGTASTADTGVRIRRAMRAAHLRVIERIGPSNVTATGQVIPFHRHVGPRPAA